MQASSGGSAVIERYFPKTIAKNQYKPGFRLKLMSKDLNLALACREAAGHPQLRRRCSRPGIRLDEGAGQRRG